MYDRLVDVRIYHPKHTPKVKSRTGAVSGLVLPFDLWRISPAKKTTLICAGEKDMAIVRSKGFNAITFTGGVQAEPAILEPFRDRAICIVYDNDDAGIGASQRAIKEIKKAGS